MSSKEATGAKGKPKTREQQCSNKSASKEKSNDKAKSQISTQSKKKSGEGKRSKTKSSEGTRSKRKSKDGSKSETVSAKDMPATTQKKIGSMVRKIEACKGAIAVSSEKAFQNAGYSLESVKLFHSDYSQVLRAKKNGKGGFVAKVVNLTECSPRSRTNLLQNSLPILRFISGVNEKQKEPLSPLFIAVFDIFLVGGCKLYIFMPECKSASSLYDLVKTGKTIAPTDIRKWFRSMVTGIDTLQQMGVANRGIKLQNVLFASNGDVKLCGWSKSVFVFEPQKNRILLQRKERRVRRNYHLPPEAFLGSYDPSKGDIWSLGVALVAMCTGRYPFNVRDTKTKFSSQWREFVKFHELNTLARNLCHKTFIIDPKRRIVSGKLLEEKYFFVSPKKLVMLSCKADPTDVHEDSRLGAMSIVEMGPDEKDTKETSKIGGGEAPNEPANEPPVTEEPVNWVEEAKADNSGIEEKATGFEGGNVGAEENIPAGEQEDESPLAEKNAPEEAEAEAQPEEAGETPGSTEGEAPSSGIQSEQAIEE